MIPYTPTDIILQTNQYRAEQGLAPVTEDPALSRAALYRAKDMAVTNNFSHRVATTSPLKAWWNFMEKENYPYQLGGENIARGYKTVDDNMKGWRESPTHNKNLTGEFSDIGVAVVPGKLKGKDIYYVVQLFGTKKGQKMQVIGQVAAPKAVKGEQKRELQFPQMPMNMANTTPMTRKLTGII